MGHAGKIDDDADRSASRAARSATAIERFGGVDHPRAARGQARCAAIVAVERSAENRFRIGHPGRIPENSLGVLEPLPATP